jgi:DNA-binding NarL/FixJ family response regulator
MYTGLSLWITATGTRSSAPSGRYIPRELVLEQPLAEDANLETLSDAEKAKKLGLTPRQFDVLCHLLGGYVNKVIILQLDLTEATVNAHATVIMKALKVEKRAQVPMALENLGIEIKSLAK